MAQSRLRMGRESAPAAVVLLELFQPQDGENDAHQYLHNGQGSKHQADACDIVIIFCDPKGQLNYPKDKVQRGNHENAPGHAWAPSLFASYLGPQHSQPVGAIRGWTSSISPMKEDPSIPRRRMRSGWASHNVLNKSAM
eukprot:CAMPEP_0178430450 /NCGR_PEP_ID=MMETSP0689_2-20121128/31325_1 /TAXON_ID=160604 /ORGANISM="Amphidinium massartii, Strain CS-259" /LENGTH=138 /DNA_ID=CAMNT_0020052305 /DNA_START=70 /DNA_END=487 /DNA_ORIENTATION=+